MIKDSIIIITGSIDGLGRRVAEKLAASGVRLLVRGRDAARGKAVIDSIERMQQYMRSLHQTTASELVRSTGA